MEDKNLENAPETAEETEVNCGEGSTEDLNKKIEELTSRYNEMKEVAARAQADGINYRNRMEREMKRIKTYGSERAVLAMLPVFDNLDRALESAESDPDSLKEGVRMIHSQFIDTLKGLGVSPLDPVGETFDPVSSDAMGMVPVTRKEQDGLVHTVVLKGFKMAEKVIRPARVLVGKFTELKSE